MTRDAGLTAMDGITDTALRIGSALADMASTVFVHTSDLLADGQEMVVDNFEEVKKLGEKGINYVEKAFAATGEFVSDNLYKLPFVEIGTSKHRQDQDAAITSSIDYDKDKKIKSSKISD